MLLCLFAAAGLGIVSVFSQSAFGGRSISTSIVIAIACALSIGALPRRDGQSVLISGRVWITVVALEALASLLLIWDRVLFGVLTAVTETILVSQGILVLGMICAIIPLKLLENSPGKFRKVELGSLGVTGVTTLLTIGAMNVAAIRGNTASTLVAQLFFDWFVLVVGGVVGAACAAGWVGGISAFHKALAILGMVFAVASALLWQVPVFSDWQQPAPWLVAPALLTAGLALGAAAYSIGSLIVLGSIERRLVPIISILAVVIGALGALLTNAAELSPVTLQRIGRVLTALSIVEGCLALTVIVLWRLGRKSSQPWNIAGAEVACPRCGKRSHFTTGESPCGNCGLRVLIGFRDVTCARCKHDVRGLEVGHACPECGLAVEQSAVFRSGATRQ